MAEDSGVSRRSIIAAAWAAPVVAVAVGTAAAAASPMITGIRSQWSIPTFAYPVDATVSSDLTVTSRSNYAMGPGTISAYIESDPTHIEIADVVGSSWTVSHTGHEWLAVYAGTLALGATTDPLTCSFSGGDVASSTSADAYVVIGPEQYGNIPRITFTTSSGIAAS